MPYDPKKPTGKVKTNLELFDALRKNAKEENRPKITKIADLYRNRKITDNRTAYNLILKLASTNKNQLRGAEKEYETVVAKYQEKEPTPLVTTMKRRLRRKQAPEQRIKITVSEREITDRVKAKAFANFKIETHESTRDERGNETVEFGEIARKLEPFMINSVTKALEAKNFIKISCRLVILAVEEKVDQEGDVQAKTKHHTIRTNASTVRSSNVKEMVVEQLTKLMMEMERLNERLGGSNWKVRRFEKVEVDIDKTKPPRASSYIETPEKFKNAKCGIVNVRNSDDQCFKYCLLYHVSKQGENDRRVSALKKVTDPFDWSNVCFPCSFEDISTFEENNKMCVFVYGLVLENGELVPKLDRPGNGRYLDKRVTLFRLEDSENGLAHYCYVKSLDKSMHTHKYNRDENCYMCHYCEKNVPLETYEQHLRDCYRIVEESGALLEMPEEGAVMEFKSWQNTFMLPCFGSADFDACVV